MHELQGRVCTAVLRRSKYLLLHFDGPGAPTALIHLGMSGRLFLSAAEPEPEWRTHEHWRMRFGKRKKDKHS